MDTLLFTHPACIGHDTGPGHPERPDRLRAVLTALESESFALLQRREAPEATIEQIARAHPDAFVRRLLAAVPESGLQPIDADTVLSPGSGAAALRAAGAGCAAVDAVLAGEARNAFCAVRPPGHHAEATRAMGFCLFNSVAIAVMHARMAHGLGRIAVVDFDVHHGNGTQDIFWSEPDLFYASTHQSQLYPGTGSEDETGVAGNILNAPLPPMSGGVEFRRVMERIVLPAVDSFKPELLLISAGFDAHARDPLANLELHEGDFAWATQELMRLADRHCGGRIVSTLEGGYDLRALALSTAAHVHTLMTG
ncbi:acetoin utilization deacetylase AcuC-like enzyme [Inquilinus ginsengisoli]|uniref:histone deacetylase family protein n=1 Tax=Inquilinus ginsengisoli TaxID=363840 RepID=UPI003D23037B